MVRAPCCEKMGLKRGPWTPEEDLVLVAYIQKFGHGNWRALPKQAGLLRCGKSCRLRWTNYLRPDIKRGNFTREEEDTIIELHQMLGNRWSAIAGRLPGRTDNEIKNVWHTHLKKRLKKNQTNPSDNKPRRRTILPKHEPSTEMQEPSTEMQESKPELKTESNATANPSTSEITENAANVPVSPEQSSSEVSNATDSSSHATSEENDTNVVKKEYDDSWDKLPNVGDDLWSEFTPMENFTTLEDDFSVAKVESQVQVPMPSNYSSNLDESMDFWYDLFIKAGDLPELPEF